VHLVGLHYANKQVSLYIWKKSFIGTVGYTWTDYKTNKQTNCKGIKNNTNFRKTTGIQEKLDTTCE
jgi:hypothetical protein